MASYQMDVLKKPSSEEELYFVHFINKVLGQEQITDSWAKSAVSMIYKNGVEQCPITIAVNFFAV